MTDPRIDIYPNLPKPPVGLRPQVYSIRDRLIEILEAMTRYATDDHHYIKIPLSWADEAHDCVARLAELRRKLEGSK